MATKHNKIKLREVNRHLVCRLCRGYYVDATTIAECLHSFCRSCIIKYLEKNSFCPICEVQIHKTKPYLSLRLDKALQDVVYKVVPGLYHDEMRRRREFYSEQKERLPFATPEQCGLEERIIFSPEDSISLSLEYLDSDYLESETVSSQSSDSGDTQDGFSLTQHLNLKLKVNDKSSRRESQDTQEPSTYPKRYLQCPAVVNIGHLKKFVRMKHELNSKAQVDIIHKRVPLPDHYTLMDVAYIYTWKRSAPLRLFYQIYRAKKQKVIMPTSMPKGKNTELLPLKDLNKEKKSEINDKIEDSSAVNHVSKINKNINGATPNPLESISREVHNTENDLVALRNPNMNKSVPESKTKDIVNSVRKSNDDKKKESWEKDKVLSPFKNKTFDKVKVSDTVSFETNSKMEKPCTNGFKVEKLSAEELKENSSKSNERLLLNPVSGQLESVPFEDFSNSAAGRIEEKKDKVKCVKKEKPKKESDSMRKIKVNKNQSQDTKGQSENQVEESENIRKEKTNRKDSVDVRKEKAKRKESEIVRKEKISKKELTNVRKEKVNRKDWESVRKEKEQKKEPENTKKEDECKKDLECGRKENEQKKKSENLKKEKEQNKEFEGEKKEKERKDENVTKQTEKLTENFDKEKEQKKDHDNSRKDKLPNKEEENEKKSNLNILKSFRKEKQITKETKIELKTSNGSTLTITALPRTEEKPAETENSKMSTEVKDDNVYDFDKSSSPEKSDLFTKQVKNTKSKYLMEHRDKWLAKEAAGEWMTFQEYREMLLKENNATENVCTRAKRKSVPNLFRISPEENRRGVNKECFGKPDEMSKEKKQYPIIFNIHTNDEDKKTVTSKNNMSSPPRPIKIENKGGEYFIKQENSETNGKSPEGENQKTDGKYTHYEKVIENYPAKADEVNKKSKSDDLANKNFGAIDLTKGEAYPKERKNSPENVTVKPNKALKEEEKTSSKVNLEPLLKVPQYAQNLKNSKAKDWPPASKNFSPNELSQAFLHLKRLDAINQFNPNAVLEQFAKKTGNLDLLYQQKIDFIRRLKRHQQAAEDGGPEKRQKYSPPGDKKHSPVSEAKEKTRPTSEEVAALKKAEDLKTLSRIQDLLEIQRAVTQNFKMPPALLQFYSRPRPYPPPIAPNLPNAQLHSTSQLTKSQNLGSPSGSLPLAVPNASFLDSPNYGHLLSAAGLHTEMSFHQTFKNYLRRQEENPPSTNLPLVKKPPRLKDESKKSLSDKHLNPKTSAAKQEPAELVDSPET